MSTIDLNEPIMPAQPDLTRAWSPFQSSIFDAVVGSADNLIVEAVAGSGKTTTIVEAMHRLLHNDPSLDVIYLAFNKSIADEVAPRVPPGVTVQTFHAFSFATFGKRPRVFGGRMRRILKDIMPNQFYENYSYDLIRMLSLIRNNAIFAPQIEDFTTLLEDYDIFIEERDETKALAYAKRAFDIATQVAKPPEIDFDDMIFLPMMYDFTLPSVDVAFIDEAQDLSPLQHILLQRLGARVIAVGDSRQAIYGFRGADHTSMDRLRSSFACIDLPLSISYRCPQRIVEAVQHIVPQITASPNAALGTIGRIPDLPYETMSSGDICVCRNNAPLFHYALLFIKRKLPVSVKSSFETQLRKFIKDFKTNDISLFIDRLDKWYDTESKRLADRGQTGKLGVLSDKYHAVKILATDAVDVDEIHLTLDRLFSDGGTKLMTIHKAKGMEAERVFFLEPSLIPSPFAKSEASRTQEYNLQYVATTRSLSELYYVGA